ncbi:MAG: ABC transporter substrate-binding protein [Actinobacteria bacterium]|nr:ABC transporter substrate-binding protein [Actinomycetota bacterium]
MNGHKKTFFLLLVLVVFAMVAAACAGPATLEDFTPKDPSLGGVLIGADEPIKIATLQAMSGAVASLGQDQVRGVEIAIDEKPEILGHKVDLAFKEDDLCSSEGGTTGAQRIVSDPQVIGVIGTSCSGAGVPASKIVSEAGRVMISGSNTSPVLTEVGGVKGAAWQPGYYRTAHNDAVQGAAAANFVYTKLGLTKVSTINDGDPYTQGLTTAFGKSFKDLGGDIVLATAIGATDTDMRPVLTEVAASGAQLIFFPIFQPAGDFIAGQAKEVSGLEDVKLMGADGLLSDTYVVLPQTKGMYFSGPATPKTAAYADFVKTYESKFGEKPIQAFHAQAHDAAIMLLDAIEAVAQQKGDVLYIDMKDLRDALYKTDIQGLTGHIVCNQFGDCADAVIDIVQNTDATADITAVKANVLYEFRPGQ